MPDDNETVAGCTDTGTANGRPPKVAGTGDIQVIANGGLADPARRRQRTSSCTCRLQRRRLRGHADHRVDLRGQRRTCRRHDDPAEVPAGAPAAKHVSCMEERAAQSGPFSLSNRNA